MPRKRKGRGSLDSEAEDFVPAVVARSPEEAEEYRELLNDHDIPAILQMDEDEPPASPGRQRPPRTKGISRGVAVLVPEALLDEASEVIADRDYDHIRTGEELEEEDEEEEDELGLDPLVERPGAEKGGKSPFAPKDKTGPFDDDEDFFEFEEEAEGTPVGQEDDKDLEEGGGEEEEDEEEEDEGA